MLLIDTDRSSAVPVYQQIYEQIVRLVDGGALAPGDRLPPTRTLALRLGVHRSTVLRAYAELWALGYLESRPGSYSTVRQRARPVATSAPVADDGTGPTAKPLIDWEKAATPAVRRAHADILRHEQGTVAREGAIDLARLAADSRLAPHDDIRACLKSVLARQGDVLDYGDARGYPPLREAIARRMRAHGVAVSADEVLVTNGAQQGIDLVLRLLARPGDGVALESPTYSMAIPLVRLHGLVLREIPMRDDGMDLDVLERTLRRRRPALVYTVPNFHNPTGITTSQPHRERLLALCEEHRVPIVEDGFEEEMKYFGKAVLPIKSMDTRRIVVYLGTFSKVVFPGLRVGWIAAPRACIERIHAIQRFANLSGNTLAQALAARFCVSGRYEAYLRRIHKVYRRRMQVLLEGLREHMPAGVEWTEPAGGYTLWLRVPRAAADERTLHERFLGDGVKVVPGSLFYPRPSAEPHFRLSIACVTEDEIAEGCRRLGRSLAAASGA